MSLTNDVYQLYLADQQVRGLESRVSGARLHAQQEKQRHESVRQQRDQLKSQLQETQASANNLENELASWDQKIEQVRSQMNNSKSEKEYSSFLVQLNTLKTDRSKVEERALEVMNRVDELKNQVEQAEQQLQQQEETKRQADENLRQREGEIADQLEAARARRQEAAAAVPAGTKELFDRLAESLDGEALAPVMEEDRRESIFTCGGCFMQLPLERVNQLLTLTDQLVRCSSCHRILYLETEVQESLGVRK